ncbi:hypothetical protein BC940DRAFT_323262 [Gongronella butleri]|nr:hypothetical protein BC940DRAFT_323262 [Gongronella butleri]
MYTRLLTAVVAALTVLSHVDAIPEIEHDLSNVNTNDCRFFQAQQCVSDCPAGYVAIQRNGCLKSSSNQQCCAVQCCRSMNGANENEAEEHDTNPGMMMGGGMMQASAPRRGAPAVRVSRPAAKQERVAPVRASTNAPVRATTLKVASRPAAQVQVPATQPAASAPAAAPVAASAPAASAPAAAAAAPLAVTYDAQPVVYAETDPFYGASGAYMDPNAAFYNPGMVGMYMDEP